MNGILNFISQKIIFEKNKLEAERRKKWFTNSELWFNLFQTPASQFGFTEFTIEKLVKKTLREMEVPFQTDEKGNIYSLKHSGKPLLSAHMDSVQKAKDLLQPYSIEWDMSVQDYVFRGTSCIGADDKVGIYLILEQLRIMPELNFIFSVEEEVGMKGIKFFCEQEVNKKKLQTIPYGLILDRRNGTDIIGFNNKYCTKDFEKRLEDLGYGFKGATGLCSDANSLKDYFSVVNLSVGYYNPHRDDEFVVLSEMEDCQEFLDEILIQVTEAFPPFKEEIKVIPASTYSSYRCYVCGSPLDTADRRAKLMFLDPDSPTKAPGNYYEAKHICPSCTLGQILPVIESTRKRKLKNASVA